MPVTAVEVLDDDETQPLNKKLQEFLEPRFAEMAREIVFGEHGHDPEDLAMEMPDWFQQMILELLYAGSGDVH